MVARILATWDLGGWIVKEEGRDCPCVVFVPALFSGRLLVQLLLLLLPVGDNALVLRRLGAADMTREKDKEGGGFGMVDDLLGGKEEEMFEHGDETSPSMDNFGERRGWLVLVVVMSGGGVVVVDVVVLGLAIPSS
jgi:hypothetical protein